MANSGMFLCKDAVRLSRCACLSSNELGHRHDTGGLRPHAGNVISMLSSSGRRLTHSQTWQLRPPCMVAAGTYPQLQLSLPGKCMMPRTIQVTSGVLRSSVVPALHVVLASVSCLKVASSPR